MWSCSVEKKEDGHSNVFWMYHWIAWYELETSMFPMMSWPIEYSSFGNVPWWGRVEAVCVKQVTDVCDTLVEKCSSCSGENYACDDEGNSVSVAPL